MYVHLSEGLYDGLYVHVEGGSQRGECRYTASFIDRWLYMVACYSPREQVCLSVYLDWRSPTDFCGVEGGHSRRGKTTASVREGERKAI